MCRGEFAISGDLMRELSFDKDFLNRKVKRTDNEEGLTASISRQFELSVKHPDTSCVDCNCTPIIGRLYGLRFGDESAKPGDIGDLMCTKCFMKCVQEPTENTPPEKRVFFWKDVSNLPVSEANICIIIYVP